MLRSKGRRPFKPTLTIREALTGASIQLQAALKAASPYLTGALKKSIEVDQKDNELFIDMLSYGITLNYRNPKHMHWVFNAVDPVLETMGAEIADKVADDIMKSI